MADSSDNIPMHLSSSDDRNAQASNGTGGQSNGTTPPLPGDAFGLGDSFDPGQYAVHGLLSVFFSTEQTDRTDRVNKLLARALERESERTVEEAPATFSSGSMPVESSLPARLRTRVGVLLPRRRWVVVGLAAVAAAVAAGFFWRLPSQALADVYADATNAGTGMFYFLSNAAALFMDSPDAAREYRQALDQQQAKLDRAKAKVIGVSKPSLEHIQELLNVWQASYCSLRDVGDKQGALAENQAAIDFVLASGGTDDIAMWPGILLDGRANIHATFGDYAAARNAYMESIEYRRATPGNEHDPHRGEPGYEGHLTNALMIPYLRMVVLGIAEGDLNDAGDWFARAEVSLHQHLTTICELNGVQLSDTASVWEIWNTLPEEFRSPREDYTPEQTRNWPPAWRIYCPGESLLHKMGALLYHQAMLARLKGDLAAAATALDRAATLEQFLARNPRNDEYRLPLVLRLERARLAIINGRYAEAMDQLDQAEDYVTTVKRRFAAADRIDPSSIPEVHKLPISPARHAEMALLRGIALLGSDPKNPEGLRLVQNALTVPEILSSRLPAEQRKEFLRQFETWSKLAEASR